MEASGELHLIWMVVVACFRSIPTDMPDDVLRMIWNYLTSLES